MKFAPAILASSILVLTGCQTLPERSTAPAPLPPVIKAPEVLAGDCWSYTIKAPAAATTPAAQIRLQTVYAFCASQIVDGKIQGWQITQGLDPREDLEGKLSILDFDPTSLQIIFKDDWSALDSGGARLINRLDGITFPLPAPALGTAPEPLDPSFVRLADESIAVPAGSFTAAHLRRQSANPNATPTQYDVWYAPEVKRDVRTEFTFMDPDLKKQKVSVELLDFSSGHAVNGDPINDQHAAVAYLLSRLQVLKSAQLALPEQLPAGGPFNGFYVPKNASNLAGYSHLRNGEDIIRGLDSLSFSDKVMTIGISEHQAKVPAHRGMPEIPSVYAFCRSGDTIRLVNDGFSGDAKACDEHSEDFPDLVFKIEGTHLTYVGTYSIFPTDWVRVSDLPYDEVYRHPDLDPDSRPEDYTTPPPRLEPYVNELTLDQGKTSPELLGGASRDNDEVPGDATKITASNRSVITVEKSGKAQVIAPAGDLGPTTIVVAAKAGAIDVLCPGRPAYRIVDAIDKNYIRTGPQKKSAAKGLEASFINSQQFGVSQKGSNEKLRYLDYRIEASSGQTIEGITDDTGSTVRVYSCDSVVLNLYTDE